MICLASKEVVRRLKIEENERNDIEFEERCNERKSTYLELARIQYSKKSDRITMTMLMTMFIMEFQLISSKPHQKAKISEERKVVIIHMNDLMYK